MGNIIDDYEKIEQEIADKRHNELRDDLRGLSESIKNIKLLPKDDSELKSILSRANTSHDAFVKKISELQKLEIPTPQVSVSTDNSDLVQSFKLIADEVIKSNEKLISKIDEMVTESKRKKDFNMKIERNHISDMIVSVNGEIK